MIVLIIEAVKLIIEIILAFKNNASLGAEVLRQKKVEFLKKKQEIDLLHKKAVTDEQKMQVLDLMRQRLNA